MDESRAPECTFGRGVDFGSVAADEVVEVGRSTTRTTMRTRAATKWRLDDACRRRLIAMRRVTDDDTGARVCRPRAVLSVVGATCEYIYDVKKG